MSNRMEHRASEGDQARAGTPDGVVRAPSGTPGGWPGERVCGAWEGVALLQTARSTVAQTTAVVSRMDALARRSIALAEDGEERSHVDEEFIELSQEVSRLAEVCESNGVRLAAGGHASILIRGVRCPAVRLGLEDLRAAALGVDAAQVSVGSVQASRRAVASLQGALSFLQAYGARLASTASRLSHPRWRGPSGDMHGSGVQGNTSASDAVVTARLAGDAIARNAGAASRTQASRIRPSALALLR